ncbi:hypothetical protein SLA2020_085480 [Shorea laevis]
MSTTKIQDIESKNTHIRKVMITSGRVRVEPEIEVGIGGEEVIKGMREKLGDVRRRQPEGYKLDQTCEKGKATFWFSY